MNARRSSVTARVLSPLAGNAHKGRRLAGLAELETEIRKQWLAFVSVAGLAHISNLNPAELRISELHGTGGLDVFGRLGNWIHFGFDSPFIELSGSDCVDSYRIFTSI